MIFQTGKCSKIHFKVVFSAYCTALDPNRCKFGIRKFGMVTLRELQIKTSRYLVIACCISFVVYHYSVVSLPEQNKE